MNLPQNVLMKIGLLDVLELSTGPIRVANNLGGKKATLNFPDNQGSTKTSWADQEFVVKIKENSLVKSIEKTLECLETLLTYLETFALKLI